MSVLEIVIVLITLLVAVSIILKIRKKNSSCPHCPPKAPANPTIQEPEKQQPEVKSADNVDLAIKPSTVDSSELELAAKTLSDIELSTEPQADDTMLKPESAAQPVSDMKPSVKPQIVETKISIPENNSSLPEDSILKRHYFTHVCTMVEALAPSRPTDAVLCRHYDAMIVAKIDQCLNDKQALAQLLEDYQNNKPTDTIEAPATNNQAAEPSQQASETTASAPESTSSLPEDSILRRHYLTHLCTMIEALAPSRPTDAVLCRHYDAMVVARIGQCLNDKYAMQQLLDDYENLSV